MKKSILTLTILCFLITSVFGTYPLYAQEFRLPAPGIRVASYADYILTVEGGMMHLSYLLGKPMGIVMKSEAGHKRWFPLGASSNQGIVADVSVVGDNRSQEESENVLNVSKIRTDDSVKLASDEAMNSQKENGGIDLTSSHMNVEVKTGSLTKAFARPNASIGGDDKVGSGNESEGIKFHLDAAQLAQLQNAQGFVPVIINIQPMTDLRMFLGLSESNNNLT